VAKTSKILGIDANKDWKKLLKRSEYRLKMIRENSGNKKRKLLRGTGLRKSVIIPKTKTTLPRR